jgi:hypothetical protein
MKIHWVEERVKVNKKGKRRLNLNLKVVRKKLKMLKVEKMMEKAQEVNRKLRLKNLLKIKMMARAQEVNPNWMNPRKEERMMGKLQGVNRKPK